MADNVTITSGANSTPPAGTVVAADEVTISATSVKVQRVKIGTGVDGTYDGDVSDSNPLPVDDAGGSLTVDATNLDIRDLTSASDSVAAVQSGTWNVTNVSGTVSLPTGASTAARQDTGNTSLSSIDGKLPALVSSRVPVDGSGVTQPVSAASLPLPSGAATSANQDTLNTRAGDLTETAPTTDTASSGLNGRLQRIAQRITSLIALFPTSLGQKAKAASMAVVLASDSDALPITDNSGSLTVDNAGTFAVQISSAIPAGTNNIGDVDIASAPTGSSAIQVQGTAAHDAASVGNPLINGGVAESTRPATVADGDAVQAYFTLDGKQIVKIGSGEHLDVNQEYTSSQTDTELIAAPGASLAIEVYDIVLSTGTLGTVLLEEGTSTRWLGRLNFAANGGASINSAKGLRIATNTSLTITTTTAAGPLAVYINYAIVPA